MYPFAFPIGVAGGGLSGTYPNPTINPGALSLLGAVTGFANATLINGPSPILITPDNLHPTFSADDQGVLLGRSDASQQAMRIAPLVGSETAFAGLWVGAAALAPSGANYCIAFSSAGNDVQWAPSAINPQYTQAQQANGSNPNSLVFAPQAPGAGAASTATGTPGSLVVSLAVPVSTGTEAMFQLQRAGANLLKIVQNATFTQFVAQANAASNYSLLLGVSLAAMNNTTEAALLVNQNGAVSAQANGVMLFTRTAAFGGGTGVLGIANATTNPTANPVGGSVIYGDVGGAGTVVRGSSGTITTIPS